MTPAIGLHEMGRALAAAGLVPVAAHPQADQVPRQAARAGILDPRRRRARLQAARARWPLRARLLVDEPGKFRRAALRWHARYCGELPDVGFEEAHAVLACLAGLVGRRPKPAASTLAELVHRRGLKRASEALTRWAS